MSLTPYQLHEDNDSVRIYGPDGRSNSPGKIVFLPGDVAELIEHANLGLQLATAISGKTTLRGEKYKAAIQFAAGFAAAMASIALSKVGGEKPTKHWMAGYQAGWKLRFVRDALVNEYLINAKLDPLLTVTPTGTDEQLPQPPG